MITIRKLEAADAVDYRDIRLEALSRQPDAFVASMAEDEGLPIARYQAALTTNTIFGAFRNGALNGVVAFARPTFVKAQHKAHITGIYCRDLADVDEFYRGLIKAVLDGAARDGIERVYARVSAAATDLLALFRRFEFQSYGTEARALRLEDGRYVDHYLMCRDLLRTER